MQSMPEVESTSRRTGLQTGLAAVTEANTGDFTVKLKAKRSRSVWEVMDDVREQIKTTEPELDIELTQILQDNINDLSNAPEPIQIKIFSDDRRTADAAWPARRRRHRQDSRRGRRRERHRQHHQRPGDQLPGRSAVAARGWALLRRRSRRMRLRFSMAFPSPIR